MNYLGILETTGAMCVGAMYVYDSHVPSIVENNRKACTLNMLLITTFIGNVSIQKYFCQVKPMGSNGLSAHIPKYTVCIVGVEKF